MFYVVEKHIGWTERPSFIEAARRTQLIAYAIETIASLGYAQASLAHIAKLAGISKSTSVAKRS